MQQCYQMIMVIPHISVKSTLMLHFSPTHERLQYNAVRLPLSLHPPLVLCANANKDKRNAGSNMPWYQAIAQEAHHNHPSETPGRKHIIYSSPPLFFLTLGTRFFVARGISISNVQSRFIDRGDTKSPAPVPDSDCPSSMPGEVWDR